MKINATPAAANAARNSLSIRTNLKAGLLGTTMNARRAFENLGQDIQNAGQDMVCGLERAFAGTSTTCRR